MTRQVDARRGGVLSSGMEYPGRYSRWHVAYVTRASRSSRAGGGSRRRAQRARPGAAAGARRRAAPGRRDGRGRAAPGRSGGRSRSQPGSSPRRTAAAGPRCSPRCARSSPRSPARTRTSACTARSATTWPSSSSRSGSAPPRPAGQRDLVLHLPDELFVLDRKRETAPCYSYEFEPGGASTAGLPRATPRGPRAAGGARRARAGPELPERPGAGRPTRGWWSRPGSGSPAATCSRWCRATCSTAGATRPPRSIERLRQRNPAPYEFFFNLGEGECLVGASPEMYVRVTGDRVETCPISGTIAARRRPAGRRGEHPGAAQLGQGGVRADHVHRRGPQRQVAGLRAGQRPGHRAAADRDVQPADPHGRPHRGAAAARA